MSRLLAEILGVQYSSGDLAKEAMPPEFEKNEEIEAATLNQIVRIATSQHPQQHLCFMLLKHYLVMNLESDTVFSKLCEMIEFAKEANDEGLFFSLPKSHLQMDSGELPLC